MQALDGQSSRKDVREFAKSCTADDSSLTKEESIIFPRKLSHVKDHCVSMQHLFFESVSQSSARVYVQFAHNGHGETGSAVLDVEGGHLTFSCVRLASFHLYHFLKLSMQPNRVDESVP